MLIIIVLILVIVILVDTRSFKKYEALENITCVQLDVANEESVNASAALVKDTISKSMCWYCIHCTFRIHSYGCIQKTDWCQLLWLCVHHQSFSSSHERRRPQARCPTRKIRLRFFGPPPWTRGPFHHFLPGCKVGRGGAVPGSAHGDATETTAHWYGCVTVDCRKEWMEVWKYGWL